MELIPFAQQAGSLDVSFGGSYGIYGKVKTAIGTKDDKAYAMALQPDGKILVAGSTENSTRDFAVVRYNTDGSLDTSFDTDGKVSTAIGTSSEGAYSVAIQTDGKIVVAGYANISGNTTDFALVRYNTDGSLDTSFDTDGKVTTSIGTSDAAAYAMVLQPNGKIVVAGYSDSNNNYDFALVRYNTDGSLDTSFDSDGIVTTAIGTFDDYAFSVTLQSNGKIVVAGNTYINGRNTVIPVDFAVVRYNTNGSLDTSFDTDGKVTTDIGIGDYASALAVQPDGKIILVGSTYDGNYDDFAVIRYNTDGSLDSSFDTDGKVTTAISPFLDYATAVTLQTDGKIVVAGTASLPPYDDLDFAVVRYNTNGGLDNSYDLDGKVTTNIGSTNNDQARTRDDVAYAVAIQLDGKIVVAGSFQNPSDFNFAITRYHGISDFNSNKGKIYSTLGISNETANTLAISPDGKIVSAGRALNAVSATSNNDFGFVWHNADGSLSSSRSTDIGNNSDDRLMSMSIMADNKIIAGGQSTLASGQFVFALVRYLSNGTLDNTFGTNGQTITAYNSTNIYARALAIQPDGKIVMVGYTDIGFSGDIIVVRYLSNGTLDTSFDGDGIKIIDINSNDYANAVKIDANGKIVVAGYTGALLGGDFCLLRLNSNGSLDNTFGTNGIQITIFGSSSSNANAMEIQPDGKIILAGSIFSNSFVEDIAMARYNTNGSLDTGFGIGGKVVLAVGSPSNSDKANAIALTADGKIYLAGNTHYVNSDMLLLRFLANGALDTNFGTSGIIQTSIGYANDFANAIVTTSDGYVYLAGSYYNGANDDFALVRISVCPTLTLTLVSTTHNYPNASLPNPQIGKTITATNYVLSTANVTYQAAQSITLNPGFKVDNGAVFKTEIVGCSY